MPNKANGEGLTATFGESNALAWSVVAFLAGGSVRKQTSFISPPPARLASSLSAALRTSRGWLSWLLLLVLAPAVVSLWRPALVKWVIEGMGVARSWS
jgi:hypothetical protein